MRPRRLTDPIPPPQALPNNVFTTARCPTPMKFTTRQAIAFSIVARYLGLVVQFGSMMILARLLTPEEIGIYSAGFSVVALAHLFRDFGLNQYLIQARELTQERITTAFTLTLLISWLLGLVVYLSSAPVAVFFKQAGIEPLVKLLSINFFIIPFGSITLALLRKRLKFQVTASIAVIASLVGVVVSVVTALQGAGYYCLAYGAIAESLSMVLLSIGFRPPELGFRLGLRGGRDILKFGSIVGVGNIVQRLALSATDALVARFLGMAALGFFSRAFGTFSLFDRLFTGSISGVILPLFSRDNHDNQLLARGYLKALDYTAIFAWPFFCFLYFFTPEVILLLYGPQWDAAVPLVKILCFAGLLLPPILFSDNLFIAFGRPDITLKIRLVANGAKLAMVAVASQVSLQAVCLALVGFYGLKLLVTLYYLRWSLGVGLSLLGRAAIHTLPCLILAMTPALLLRYWLLPGNQGILWPMLIIAAATAIGWLVGLLVSRHPFCVEIQAVAARLPGLRAAMKPRNPQGK